MGVTLSNFFEVLWVYPLEVYKQYFYFWQPFCQYDSILGLKLREGNKYCTYIHLRDCAQILKSVLYI